MSINDTYKSIGDSFKVRDIASSIISYANPNNTIAEAVQMAYESTFENESENIALETAACIVKESNRILGYVWWDDFTFEEENFLNNKVGEYCNKIEASLIVSADMPIMELIPLFEQSKYFFVLEKNNIEQIVTDYDLDKLPIKMCILTLIFNLESNLNSSIINSTIALHQKEIDLEACIAPKRYTEIMERVDSRRKKCSSKKQSNTKIEHVLLETTFADKKEIILKNFKQMGIEGFSKSKLGKDFELIEKVRNSIVHGNSIVDIFKSNTELSAFVNNLHRLIKHYSNN